MHIFEILHLFCHDVGLVTENSVTWKLQILATSSLHELVGMRPCSHGCAGRVWSIARSQQLTDSKQNALIVTFPMHRLDRTPAYQASEPR
jgi:hypothetical protein